MTSKTTSFTYWLLAALGMSLLAAIAYATTTSWQNARALEAFSTDSDQRLSRISADNARQIREIGEDVKGIKRAFISLLIDKRPDKVQMAKDLVSSASIKGIDQFNRGELPAAYAIWTESARLGDQDSAYAIAKASSSLRLQLSDPTLAPEQRVSFLAALKLSPEVQEIDGKYVLKKSD